MSMRLLLAMLALAFVVSGLPADEGMWLFTHPPREQLKDKHHFDTTDSWLEHLQKSSVRFGAGGSASFVSADGLVMTNHHVGRGTIAKLGGKDKDLVATGFYARTRADELKCPDVE